MPMKISLALGPRQPLSRQTAWGCLTTNFALPGFGSLLAGRPSGYGQVALMSVGLIISVVIGLRCIVWFLTDWTRLQEAQLAEPIAAVQEMWSHLRWPLVGIGSFGIGWGLAQL